MSKPAKHNQGCLHHLVLRFAEHGVACELVTGFTRKTGAELLHERHARQAYLRTPAGQAALKKSRMHEKQAKHSGHKPDAERSRLMKKVHDAYGSEQPQAK
ncbi:MAG: hypothetical protein RL318_2129 [Fibrobacterota bacterium]|jgi:hypothetical protein